jgi:lysophospholipase L1-like esterase
MNYSGLPIYIALCCALCASAKDLSKGGTVLLLGDSILDCHAGDHRIEVVMKGILDERMPQAQWTVYNEAHGGEYIGPKEGTPSGTSGPLFTTETAGRYFQIVQRHPQVDAVIVNYAANDSKVYPPARFRQKLEMLGGMLEKQYPGALLIFSTSVYMDPAHAAPYRYDNPQVPGFKNGSLRNEYLEPYNQEIREFTAAHGYGLSDTYRRIMAETAKGNWDLRIRAKEGATKEDDAKHAGSKSWFDNIHPNDAGTKVIAEGLVEALTKSR